MTDIDQSRREQAEVTKARYPRWRLTIIMVLAAIGMLLWLVLDHLHMR